MRVVCVWNKGKGSSGNVYVGDIVEEADEEGFSTDDLEHYDDYGMMDMCNDYDIIIWNSFICSSDHMSDDDDIDYLCVIIIIYFSSMFLQKSVQYW